MDGKTAKAWPLQNCAVCKIASLLDKLRAAVGGCRLGSSSGGSGCRLEACGMGLLLHSGVAYMVPARAQAGAAAA